LRIAAQAEVAKVSAAVFAAVATVTAEVFVWTSAAALSLVNFFASQSLLSLSH